MLQESEERREAESAALRKLVAKLRRELKTLTRISKTAAGAEAVAAARESLAEHGEDSVVPAALAALSSDEMRRELATQYALLSDMGEALEAAEGRVRDLERWKDLANLAAVADEEGGAE